MIGFENPRSRSLRQISTPLPSGSLMSRITRSGNLSSISRKASIRFSASNISSKPSAANCSLRVARERGRHRSPEFCRLVPVPRRRVSVLAISLATPYKGRPHPGHYINLKQCLHHLKGGDMKANNDMSQTDTSRTYLKTDRVCQELRRGVVMLRIGTSMACRAAELTRPEAAPTCSGLADQGSAGGHIPAWKALAEPCRPNSAVPACQCIIWIMTRSDVWLWSSHRAIFLMTQSR